MVDRAAGLIRLPAVFVKQGRGHNVPITATLAEILDSCPHMAGSDLVFASPRSGGPVGGWSQLLDPLKKRAKVDFTPHDLRRTFRTGLSRLGIDDPLAELAIGHVRKDLEARYNRDAASEAIRKALDAWDAHVTGLLAADATKREAA